MNGTERILNTLFGRAVDRCPSTALLSLYGARLSDCPLDRYYRDPAAYAAGQAAVLERFGPDVIFGPFDFASVGEAFGSSTRFARDQAPNVWKAALSSHRDWARLVFPDPAQHPLLEFHVQAVARLAALADRRCVVAACLPPVTDIPALVLGIEGWLEAIVSDREAAVRIMRSLLPWHRAMARRLFAAGASVIAMPCAFASPEIVPREIAWFLMRPVLEAMLQDIGGPVVLHHGGASILAHLDIFKGLPSVAAYFLDEGDALQETRRILGADTVLFRGPQAARLPMMSPALIAKECSETVRENGGVRRFILGNSGPDVPWSTPESHLDALFDAAQAMEGSPNG